MLGPPPGPIGHRAVTWERQPSARWASTRWRRPQPTGLMDGAAASVLSRHMSACPARPSTARASRDLRSPRVDDGRFAQLGRHRSGASSALASHRPTYQHLVDGRGCTCRRAPDSTGSLPVNSLPAQRRPFVAPAASKRLVSATRLPTTSTGTGGHHPTGPPGPA